MLDDGALWGFAQLCQRRDAEDVELAAQALARLSQTQPAEFFKRGQSTSVAALRTLVGLGAAAPTAAALGLVSLCHLCRWRLEHCVEADVNADVDVDADADLQ
eukprot:scaffold4923_cov238-Pinguiococcus_pyrenoidosus.AAC.1